MAQKKFSQTPLLSDNISFAGTNARRSEYAVQAKGVLDDYDCLNPTPGPYNLPPVIGYKNHDVTKYRAPAYTIGVKRAEPMPDSLTPAPKYGTFGLTQYGKASSPKVRLRSRPVPSVYQETLGPGPGYYSPEKHINAVFRRAPAATIKGRKHPPAFDESPAPTFDPERVIGPKLPLKETAPRATVKGRKVDFSVYADDGPGPGSYNLGPVTRIMRSAPSAALGTRWQAKSVYDTMDDAPGPNAYFPKAHNFGPRAPKAFLGMRHSKCEAPNITKEDTYSLVEF